MCVGHKCTLLFIHKCMSSTSEGNPSQRPLGLRLVPGNSETSVEQLPHKLLYTQHPSPGVLPRRNSHTECANTMVHLGRDSLNLTILTTFIVSPSGLVPRGIVTRGYLMATSHSYHPLLVATLWTSPGS